MHAFCTCTRANSASASESICARWSATRCVLRARGAAVRMTKFLFNVSPIDTLTFVGGALLLTAVAFAASYLPARRATATDPMSALRFD